MSNSYSSIKVDVIRGHNVESHHLVSASVVNSNGNLVMSWGNTDTQIYPRSSIKPLQALTILTSDAINKFNVTDLELALACASHSGEIEHVKIVEQWLHRMGLSYKDLECGAHAPTHLNSAINLYKNNAGINALYNNCSGKHTGMLVSCLALGLNTHGYVQANHPLQIKIRNLIEDFCSIKISPTDIAIDGCSIPTYYLNMNSLALAMARFANPKDEFEKYKFATEKIFKTIVNNPYYLAGTDRYCTRMTTALDKSGFVKTGAEGVMFACLPSLDLGVVVKADDGASRAAETSMSWILKKLGALSDNRYHEFSMTEVSNWNQIRTGAIKIHE